jgi:hypothetical protein
MCCCSYVTLRLLGEGPDAPAVVQARNWVSLEKRNARVKPVEYCQADRQEAEGMQAKEAECVLLAILEG